MPDTDEEDSAAEAFWPEAYKQVIREEVPSLVKARLDQKGAFNRVFHKSYADQYADHDEFLQRIAEMTAIGAENGADDAFDEIIHAFLVEAPLPDVRKYARYAWPQPLSSESSERLRQVIVDEYRQDNIYIYAYHVGYSERYASFDEYMNAISELVLVGTQNGATDTIETIYRSFLKMAPLTPVRRHPRRLKAW